jgi:hypothetical protein
LHWDRMHEVGTYPALADVISAVQGRLTSGLDLSPASTARH